MQRITDILRRPWWLILAALTVVAVLAAACGSGGEEDKGATPKATLQPTSPVVDLTTDDLGRKVTAPVAAKRVVAMSPSIVELMYAVGATPAGRPSSADYPEAAKSLPDFGTSYQPNFELVAGMRPDLIIADAIIDKPMIDDLAKLGAPVFAVRVASFDDVVKGLRVVGALTGNTEAANREAKALEDKLAAIKAKQPASGPSVLVVIVSPPDQVFAARPGSYIGDLITRVGGKNVITTEPENFRLPGFSEYSLERVVEKDPDVILAISPAPRGPKTTEILARSPVWSNLRAVKQGRVLEVDPVIYLQSAGPRVSLILDELSRFFYPDIFKASR